MKEETYSKELAKLNRTDQQEESSLDRILDSTKPRTFRKPIFDEKAHESWGRPTISENSIKFSKKRARSSGNICEDLYKEGLQHKERRSSQARESVIS